MVETVASVVVHFTTWERGLVQGTERRCLYKGLVQDSFREYTLEYNRQNVDSAHTQVCPGLQGAFP